MGEWWQESDEFMGLREDYENECEHEIFYGDHDWTEPEKVDEVDGIPIYQRKCRCCGLVEEEPLVVEFWEDKFIEIAGKKYRALKSWGNISICCECGKVIMDVPLVIWDERDKTKALTFHFECAKKSGLLEKLGLDLRL